MVSHCNTNGHNLSWDDDSPSASKQISRLSQNQKVHHYTNKTPPMDHILSRLKPGHILTPNFF
jgi:hypothetical protein